MSKPEISEFNWLQFGAYRAFEGFIREFIIQRRSYITKHDLYLDFPAALKDIHARFIDHFDEGDRSFDQKATTQFSDADVNSKIVFANVEYLWAMPSSKIYPGTKREYAKRWFSEEIINKGPNYYFWREDGIANPGSYYQTNKYHEIVAILRLLSVLFDSQSTTSADLTKRKIESTCYDAIYGKPRPADGYSIDRYCGIHSALLHLSSPDKYESIISKDHKLRITNVFEHLLQDIPPTTCLEERIRIAKTRLFDKFGATANKNQKHRWFFYLEDIRDLWIGKKKVYEQVEASIECEIQDEQNAENVSDYEDQDVSDNEGDKVETSPGYRIQRSSKLVRETKQRDNFSCQACSFHFKDRIVHVHHLDPLAERQYPRRTTLDDLITLCPNCHYLSHFWLRKSAKYKDKITLLERLAK